VATLSIVAHPDDDLLFMNPDIASDIQANKQTWIMYLTAGNLITGSGGEPYADQRIHGLRAAYARAAKVSDNWDFSYLVLPSGRFLVTNTLRDKPTVRLIWTYINGAHGGDADGDLKRMWDNPAFVAHPIDGRASFTKASLTSIIKEVIEMVAVGPDDFIRVLDVWGKQLNDHVDHVYAALFSASANLNPAGKIVKRMDSYFGYAAVNMPANNPNPWLAEKTDIWALYRGIDSAFAGQPTAWSNMMDKQHRRWSFCPGDSWSPPLM
jgi:LmbE family N-acetylglucosaminyl deacetylase